jgi:hopanoid biosynthesis associated protein HpnK
VRRLIINADDFGLTPGVNRAILESHTRGVVTSATLMANSAAFDEAARIAQSSPTLSVGCHIVLVDGSPSLPPDQVATLVTGRGAPVFHDSWGKFARAALAGRLAPSHIEAEAVAQIRKLQTAGIAVTHADTHKHTHMFPRVLAPVLSALHTCGVRAIRNPFEPVRLSLLARYPALWKRWLEVRALNALARNFRQATEAAGILAPDGTLGIAATGMLDDSLFRTIVEHMPEGTWEFVCHPGYDDADLQQVRTRLRGSRQQELLVLTSSAARQLLTSNGIKLMSYGDYIGGTPEQAHLPS